VIIIALIHPEEVLTRDRGKKDFIILSLLYTTGVQSFHHVSKTILCFVGLWLDAEKLSLHGFGCHTNETV